MKTKIGTEVARVIRDADTTFNVKRSKVNLQEAAAYCTWRPHAQLVANMLHIYLNCFVRGYLSPSMLIGCTVVCRATDQDSVG